MPTGINGRPFSKNKEATLKAYLEGLVDAPRIIVFPIKFY
jgi:hypothetical protein